MKKLQRFTFVCNCCKNIAVKAHHNCAPSVLPISHRIVLHLKISIFILLLGAPFGALAKPQYSVSYLEKYTVSREIDSLISVCKKLELEGESQELCEGYNSLAIALWQRDLLEGIEDLGKAMVTISTNLRDTLWIGRSQNLLGNLYNVRGLYHEALRSYRSALDIFEQMEDTARLGTVYSNLSALYMEMKEDSTALSFGLAAYKIYDRDMDKRKLSDIHTNLGNVYSNLSDSVRAQQQYLKALQYDIELNDSVGISSGYSNLGVLFASRNNAQQAKAYFDKALFIDSLLLDLSALIVSNQNIADCHFEARNYQKALHYYQASFGIAEELKSYAYLFSNGQKIAECLGKLGREKEALEILNDLLPKYDSLFSEERRRAMVELQKSFEVYRKSVENNLLRQSNLEKTEIIDQQELIENLYYVGILMSLSIIALLLFGLRKINRLNSRLRAKNEIIQDKNEQLETKKENLEDLLNHNKTLVSLMVHDLKSPLAQISSLADIADEEGGGASSKLIKAVSSKGLKLIDDIMHLAEAENPDFQVEFEQVKLNMLLGEIIRQFTPIANVKGLSIEFNTDEQIDEVKSNKIVLTRILTNLISNAIKFSPRDRSVYINVSRKEGEIRIAIRDEGPGFQAEDLPRLFQKYQHLSAKPTGNESSTGLGLAIAKILADHLSANLVLNNKYTHGAEFFLDFRES